MLNQSTKETPGFEPGTIRSAVERSTTELYLQKKIYDSNEVRTPRVVEWSSSRWTCWVPAGSGLCVLPTTILMNGGTSPCH